MNPVTILLVPWYHTFCTEEDRPYCLKYTNSSGELAVTRFTYNSKGLNDKAFYQQITGHRSSKNLHEFDRKGNMVRKYRIYNDGETSEELFTYNTANEVIEETFSSSTGASGKTGYQYDKAGNAVKMICEGYKGWLKGEISFEFDSEGKRTHGQFLNREGSPGTIEYAYSKSGNLIHEEWKIGEWSQNLRYEYESIDS